MHLIFFRHGNTNYTENTDFLYSSSVNSVFSVFSVFSVPENIRCSLRICMQLLY